MKWNLSVYKLSSQTLSYTIMLIVTYTQTCKGFFGLSISFIHPLHIADNTPCLSPKLLGYYIRPKVYMGNVKMVNHSFFYFEEFCCVMHSFFKSIFRNNIADTDRAKCCMLSCWTPLLLSTENEGVILPLLWRSSITVINNGSDTG